MIKKRRTHEDVRRPDTLHMTAPGVRERREGGRKMRREGQMKKMEGCK